MVRRVAPIGGDEALVKDKSCLCSESNSDSLSFIPQPNHHTDWTTLWGKNWYFEYDLGQFQASNFVRISTVSNFPGVSTAYVSVKQWSNYEWWNVRDMEKRLRWSRGSMLAFGTQVRGFKPGRSLRIFQGEEILSTPSFGGEVKSSVPCRRLTVCKRFLNVTWKSGFQTKFIGHFSPT